MTRADMKFRFIIPVDEVNERGERAFLYDKARIKDSDYKAFFVGEACCYVPELDVSNELLSEMEEGIDEDTKFPEGTTDGAKAVAYEASKLWVAPDYETPKLQDRLDAYFKCEPIDVNCGSLAKCFGIPG